MAMKTELAPVAARDLQIIEYRGQRVVTTEQLAAGYGTDVNNITVNYHRNQDRFAEGKHYFDVQGEELREMKNWISLSNAVGKRARSLRLWTERGAANHAKMLETDQSWDYYNDLTEFYFTNREVVALPTPATISRKELALMVIEAEERAEAAALENKTLSATVESLEKHFTKGMTIPAFCKGLNGVNVSKMSWWAYERNWLYNAQRDPEKSPKWRVASYARDKYLTEDETQITPHGSDEFTRFTPVLLENGCHRLYQLYMKGELPMKKTWNGEYSHDKALYTPEEK
ncbi:ORF6N domain-containing protein [Enterobacter hormaechei subsp. steigerwaltii]|uniref:ORF6N domain-containing protein n=1 Tax=Enterobacter hormaechei TaxID=158836 RepID=UPI001BCB9D7B|nr:ORF6N domain-containing protein [Enterobacter hormaechei]MCC9382034.1 ORF6N domain-containing protein [Enterobacter hormaechei subsp. steigerwaltii]MCU2299215.1 ORF6N domain-containing protein [Enterobacter hormaechei subsp. steigerwaltii]MCU2321068.1 ORF6N domain-containing protein [Enterobacter hormaechei subsp. steigerwaltii]MCU2334741.1 ORF6N domain-containing protein [Enterobacter hormaechei subsp. steigerwaltii]MCU2341959.1 ORF6N domain-containing protein [Enterobacter hormaechei subs